MSKVRDEVMRRHEGAKAEDEAGKEWHFIKKAMGVRFADKLEYIEHNVPLVLAEMPERECREYLKVIKGRYQHDHVGIMLDRMSHKACAEFEQALNLVYARLRMSVEE